MTSPSPVRRFLFILALLAGAAGIWHWQSASDPDEARYRTEPADRGEIVQSITANGTLNPVVLINVGTQVSGTVYRLHADFNDRVEEGQVLAELDPALFQAQLLQSQASVMNGRTALKLAQNKMDRNRTLVEQGFISPDALEAVEQQLEAARAQLAISEAQLARDRANLGYSVIRSPISGVVIARDVDVGQTVAASFQTPTLFLIAKDLRQMQIDTSVAEADIGLLRIGQTVGFTVDAFPAREFEGTVRQVRLNPEIQHNVVSYNVIVAVSNDEGVLLPGMTANVRFMVDRRSDALRVPNAALRYRPAERDGSPPAAGGERPGTRVYRLEQGRPVGIDVRTGIADTRHTEVLEGDIHAGDALIVRETAEGSGPGGKFRFKMF
ncbi:efflux RND transporter periplasmic adaptor subunit [Nitrosovibrio sp. Nv17]|uniref:efflux RND transporter periplasmic adaptor subunit n=1 Tax=Nitrosovibrio sp. Nv17 TaxID=1855339 RepID=UPI000908797E|nr:efflux RND transporter periplasmic adaptor subunit [Nitrosovibrio sp. Nv17]SFW29668.1 HlyD family secretion protein [Nitrosovibrio sp. Nv17]